MLDAARTINITGFADLNNVAMCTRPSLKIGPDVFALLAKNNKTACNYFEPHTGRFIQCQGRESIRFSPCNFGVEEVLDISENFSPVHVMHGMVYDQVGQMLSTVSKGRLYKEGRDFKVFSFADDGIYSLEDGIMVSKTWLEEPENQETLVRFLKARLCTSSLPWPDCGAQRAVLPLSRWSHP